VVAGKSPGREIAEEVSGPSIIYSEALERGSRGSDEDGLENGLAMRPFLDEKG
jgi:hypothetical protein